MGRRILVQRKGRGSSQWRSPSHKKIAPARHPKWQPDKTYVGTVANLYHESGRGAPLAEVRFEGEKRPHYMIAPEGIMIGQVVECGDDAALANGNTLMLEYIPEGTPIYNVEGKPGDGGRFIRSSGLAGTIVTIDEKVAIVRLPSGTLKRFSPRCRATIGIVAGGGRPDKPFLKAGDVWHHTRPKARKWPVVRGAAMAAVSHPHGGGSHQSPGRPTTVSRNAPPGRKVGNIAARRTGRKK
ncbi:MAG: 50S ribosomal protein L2 [Candidatus Thorarchaeota archaeon]|nr:MAG: 50S ribosomal protein L2 [Candidatus Thorarchaeota archaeon]